MHFKLIIGTILYYDARSEKHQTDQTRLLFIPVRLTSWTTMFVHNLLHFMCHPVFVSQIIDKIYGRKEQVHDNFSQSIYSFIHLFIQPVSHKI